MKKDNILPQPDYTICPKKYCLGWLEKGNYIEDGYHPELEGRCSHHISIGSGTGFCLRDERIKNFKKARAYKSCKDWYEPCVTALDADGLSHNYFIVPKYTPKGDTNDENTEGAK